MDIPEKKYPNCNICLDDILPPAVPTFTPCIHSFHAECIKPWLEQKKYERKIPCPVCKMDISPIVGYRNPDDLFLDDDNDVMPGLETPEEPDFALLLQELDPYGYAHQVNNATSPIPATNRFLDILRQTIIAINQPRPGFPLSLPISNPDNNLDNNLDNNPDINPDNNPDNNQDILNDYGFPRPAQQPPVLFGNSLEARQEMSIRNPFNLPRPPRPPMYIPRAITMLDLIGNNYNIGVNQFHNQAHTQNNDDQKNNLNNLNNLDISPVLRSIINRTKPNNHS